MYLTIGVPEGASRITVRANQIAKKRTALDCLVVLMKSPTTKAGKPWKLWKPWKPWPFVLSHTSALLTSSFFNHRPLSFHRTFSIRTSTLQLHTKRHHRLPAFASYLQQNKHKYLRPAHIVSFPIGSLLTLPIASPPYNEAFANLALRLPRHIECYRVGAIREQCARSSRSTRRKRPAI